MMIKEQLEAIISAKDYTQRLIEGVINAIQKMRGGDILEGYQIVASIAEGLDWIIQIITLASDALIDTIDVTDLTEIIKEVIEGVENEDSILVGDLLEYEILEILQQWQSVLSKSCEKYKAYRS